MTDAVTIGHGSPAAVFRDARRSNSDDPYAGSNFVTELHSDGVDAVRTVFMFSFDWDAPDPRPVLRRPPRLGPTH